MGISTASLRHPLGKDSAALRSKVKLSSRGSRLSSSDVHPLMVQVDIHLSERSDLVRARPLIQHQRSEVVKVSMFRCTVEVLLFLDRRQHVHPDGVFV
jgi:hypothetical protein